MRANLSEVVAAVCDRRCIMGPVILSVSYTKGPPHLVFGPGVRADLGANREPSLGFDTAGPTGTR